MKLCYYLLHSSLFLGLLTLFACSPSADTTTKKSPKTMVKESKIAKQDGTEVNKKRSLTDTLNAKLASWNAKASDERKQKFQASMDAIMEGGLSQNAKKVGDKAPDFALKNAKGETVSLSSYLEKGPVVLTWYRGGWCPYCNIALSYMQDNLPDFQAEGANLLALTPEIPDKSLSTKEKNELSFEILSDLGNKAAQSYGVMFELEADVAARYQKGFGLHDYNGDESNTLPVPATYVIDQNGVIQYAYVNPDYRTRAEPADILAALQKINSK